MYLFQYNKFCKRETFPTEAPNPAFLATTFDNPEQANRINDAMPEPSTTLPTKHTLHSSILELLPIKNYTIRPKLVTPTPPLLYNARPANVALPSARSSKWSMG